MTRAVELLSVEPADRLLEIGCGGGAAVALICQRLQTGTIMAIDRSPLQVERATRRNERHVASGKATIRLAEVEDLGEGSFTKVFAINVNLFWVRPASNELDRIKRLLEPDGRLYLFYELPTVEKREAIADKLVGSLSTAGFEASTIGSPYLVGVAARAR